MMKRHPCLNPFSPMNTHFTRLIRLCVIHHAELIPGREELN
jgi:hypothetical protein